MLIFFFKNFTNYINLYSNERRDLIFKCLIWPYLLEPDLTQTMVRIAPSMITQANLQEVNNNCIFILFYDWLIFLVVAQKI